MLLEVFLTKIVLAVLRRTASPAVAGLAGLAFDLRSAFEAVHHVPGCVGSRTACARLGLAGLYAASDGMADRAVDRLLAIAESAIRVELCSTGLYIASDVIPTFKAPDTYGDLQLYFTVPPAPETDNDILGPATYHGLRGRYLLRRGRYEEAIKHMLHGSGHDSDRLEKIGDIQRQRGLYPDALRYYIAAVRHRGFRTGQTGAHDLNGKIVACYEALHRYEDALEVYFASWAPIGHYGVIYKQFRTYTDKTDSGALNLCDDRLIELVSRWRRLLDDWSHGTYFIGPEDLPGIRAAVASIERDLSQRGIVVGA